MLRLRSLRRVSAASMIALLFLAVVFVAYSNGANDNFKGVASLYGSRTCTYRTAISWATATTGAGSVAGIFLAEGLLKRFSGKGLVPDALTASPEFLLAVALGAGATVILATVLGFPISTTHGLTGALVGAGLVAGGRGGVNFEALGKNFVTPLLVSPLMAVVAGGLIYLVFRSIRLALRVGKEVTWPQAPGQPCAPVPPPSGRFAVESLPGFPVAGIDSPGPRLQRYTGRVVGLEAGKLVDALHFLTAGAVSFARGLNDTPKIAALLLVAKALDIRWGLIAVAVAMAVGGLLNARKVADTMANKITDLNPGQGFAANLATAVLVNTASYHGLPVSTTHISVGCLLGIGVTTRQAKWRPVLGILLSWVVTLPCAALLAALAYALLPKS